jgi:hypothetical protein
LYFPRDANGRRRIEAHEKATAALWKGGRERFRAFCKSL